MLGAPQNGNFPDPGQETAGPPSKKLDGSSASKLMGLLVEQLVGPPAAILEALHQGSWWVPTEQIGPSTDRISRVGRIMPGHGLQSTEPSLEGPQAALSAVPMGLSLAGIQPHCLSPIPSSPLRVDC